MRNGQAVYCGRDVDRSAIRASVALSGLVVAAMLVATDLVRHRYDAREIVVGSRLMLLGRAHTARSSPLQRLALTSGRREMTTGEESQPPSHPRDGTGNVAKRRDA